MATHIALIPRFPGILQQEVKPQCAIRADITRVVQLVVI